MNRGRFMSRSGQRKPDHWNPLQAEWLQGFSSSASSATRKKCVQEVITSTDVAGAKRFIVPNAP